MQLQPSFLVASPGAAFVLAHPSIAGNVDPVRTLVFSVHDDVATVLRDFEIEITGMALTSAGLFVVDSDANLHRFFDGNWTDWNGVGDSVPRINALRAVEERVYGLTGEGMVCAWTGTTWNQITPSDDETYLFDLALDARGNLVGTGDSGFVGTIVNGAWERLAIPARANITSVLAVSPTSTLLTGWSATALVGDAIGWTSLAVGRRDATFRNAVAWRRRVLIAADQEILELDGSRLAVFQATPVGRLASDGDVLWKQAGAQISRFDGSGWRPISLRA